MNYPDFTVSNFMEQSIGLKGLNQHLQLGQSLVLSYYSKTCVKRPLKNRPN